MLSAYGDAMKRRSSAGGELTKGPRRKAPEPKGRDVPKAVPRSKSSPPGEETEVARLTRERDEALEHQTATGDVLKIISRPSFDLQAVLDTLVKLAARLCEADLVAIHRPRDGAMQFAANFGLSQEWVEIIKRDPLVPGRGTATGRVLLAGKTVQIADVEADPEYTFTEGQRAGGFRTVLAVPLEREGETIGVIVLCRTKVNPFTDKQITLVQNFATQAVIAIENARLLGELREMLQQKTATADVLKIISHSTFDLPKVLNTLLEWAARLCEADKGVILPERTDDLTEALEQQTATSEVLRVISGSPGDLQPVFASMLENAVRICDAKFGNIYRWDGDALRLAAAHNTPAAYAEHRKRVPLRLNQMPESLGRMIAAKEPIQVEDILALADDVEKRNPVVVEAAELGGIRTVLNVPMRKEDQLVGAFIVSRQEVRPFTEKQIALVQNFAAQAVIAIENARLLNELRQRTDDLSETLEQQTASAKVLEVISRSAFDLHAVFETVAESSVRLCGADRAFIFQYEDELLRMKASFNASPELSEWVKEHPVRPGSHLASARAALHRQTIHIPDVQVDPDYLHGGKLVDAFRTVLAVPVLKSDDLLGIILIYRLDVQPFTAKQIALVETFADQAAIAIENTRLLQELRERTDEVVELNQQLELRVADQVGEIERMGRLRRFLLHKWPI